MRICKSISSNQQKVINQCLLVLKAGGMIVFPSDTVYGLLADATNPKAVTRLLEFKERKPGQAISVFVSDEKMAEEYVEINQNAKNVINNLLPGPFTVVCQAHVGADHVSARKNGQSQGLPLQNNIDPRLLAENGTLAIRIPDYPLITTLVVAYGLPLTATSANLFGRPPHYSISSFLKSLSEKKKSALNLIVDAGNLPKNKPSTVIDTTTGQLKTLRIGDLLPKTTNSFISKSEDETKQLARFLATKFIKKSLSRPLVFLLEGNLGAGKTIFAKGLGKALGITKEVVSPTYTLCYEYPIKLLSETQLAKLGSDTHRPCQITTKDISKNCSKLKKLIHYDLYRIESENDLKEIKFLESFYCGNIYVIEWPERIPAEIISALKNLAEIVYIKIAVSGKNRRLIEWGNTIRQPRKQSIQDNSV